jgi:prophage antirepressor-like protein
MTTVTTLTFENHDFKVVDWHGETWLRGQQIADALGYKNPKQAIDDLFSRNAAEFTEDMTTVIDLPTRGGLQPTRIFSLRGAHLLGMLARTDKAAAFRRWVLDVLEGREVPVAVSAMTHSQRLSYLRERRMLLQALARVTDRRAGAALHDNLARVSQLLHLSSPALEELAPALRQMTVPGLDDKSAAPPTAPKRGHSNQGASA